MPHISLIIQYVSLWESACGHYMILGLWGHLTRQRQGPSIHYSTLHLSSREGANYPKIYKIFVALRTFYKPGAKEGFSLHSFTTARSCFISVLHYVLEGREFLTRVLPARYPPRTPLHNTTPCRCSTLAWGEEATGLRLPLARTCLHTTHTTPRLRVLGAEGQRD